MSERCERTMEKEINTHGCLQSRFLTILFTLTLRSDSPGGYGVKSHMFQKVGPLQPTPTIEAGPHRSLERVFIIVAGCCYSKRRYVHRSGQVKPDSHFAREAADKWDVELAGES